MSLTRTISLISTSCLKGLDRKWFTSLIYVYIKIKITPLSGHHHYTHKIISSSSSGIESNKCFTYRHHYELVMWMCIFVLPSSINLAAKNDQYIYMKREREREEREKRRKKNKSSQDQVEFPLNMTRRSLRNKN